ncbi:DUF2007 domain-containing protein [Flavobacterium psychrotrophum]|uniref:DUF2007 domain-containing protein n=1 Tax=Flavobacterium psychrotrophum TaxID=2294119 RepID=UPI001F09B5F5|nr:DUF2007 domain-containing protein [Flavobacterium psychrotrophum]
MADSMTVDTDPLISNAIGGVKLYVRTEDTERAEASLAEISRYSVDNKGNSIVCPECGSTKVELMTTVKDSKGFLGFIFGIFLGTLPPVMKHKQHCDNCGHEFDLK